MPDQPNVSVQPNVAPDMPTNARPTPCAKTGCTATATHMPALVVPTEQYPDAAPLRALVGLPLCHDHAASLDLKEWLRPGTPYHGIFRAIGDKHGTNPDFPKAKVEAVPLGGPEHVQYQNAIKAHHAV